MLLVSVATPSEPSPVTLNTDIVVEANARLAITFFRPVDATAFLP